MNVLTPSVEKFFGRKGISLTFNYMEVIMRIQHNISALNSHRQLGNNNSAIGKDLEKLSSGYRINRAGDDAAGLAISEKMRAQIKGLETAQKNAQDGISLVQTAEGALTEVHSMLNRMVELATQSANGTYEDTVDRANLQKEVKSLKSEIDRIADSTNFNGIKLLNGNLGGRKLTSGGQGGETGMVVNGGSLEAGSAQTFTFTGAAAGVQAGATLTVGTAVNSAGGQALVSFGMASTTGNGTKGTITFEARINESNIQTDADRALADKYRGMTVTVSHNAILQAAGTSQAYSAGAGGGLSLQVGDTNHDFQKVTVQVNDMKSASLGINDISVADQAKAGEAIENIKTAINTVSSARGDLGAIQNRLEHTINNLGVTTENMTAAESRIRDVDMAKEMMEFTKNNILSQAATSMLAQANQTPQGVLQLLN